MSTSLKRKRFTTSASITNRSSSSRRSTPLVSFKRQPLALAEERQHQRWHGSPLSAASREQCVQSAAPAFSSPQSKGVPFLRNALEEEDIDDSLDHIIMAVDIKERDKVGCAYYIAREERLLCMEDVSGGGQEMIESLQVDLKPTVVLMSTRIDASSNQADQLRSARRESLIDNDDERPPLPYELETRPIAEFSYENALNKLVSLQALQPTTETIFLVPGESSTFDGVHAIDEIGLTNRQGRILQVSASLDMDNKVSIGCAGAVITYLRRKRASECLQDDPDAQLAYRVTRLEMFTISKTMLINADTLSSLQIIQPESHPNAFNQGPGTSGAKESLSIYGLFHHLARTPQGRTRLRRYFLRPSLDIDEITARLDFVSVFARPDNQNVAQKMNKNMSRIKNMRATMTLLHKGVSGGNQKLGGFKSGVWASLLDFCYHTSDVADCLNEIVNGENLPLRARGVEILDKFHLQRIGKMVHNVVDLELSIEQHRTVIKYGVNDNLDKMKQIYDGMDELLSKAARQIASGIVVDVDLNVIYFPQLGFHITVPIDEVTGEAVYAGGDTPWERMFTTKNRIYFKDTKMHNMDEQLGDLYAMICDVEIEVSYDLAQKVLLEEKLLVAVSDLCGEIDCLLALALGATQHKLTRPILTEENIIDIRGGRHLLQEMTVPSYVPNDAYLVGGHGDQFPIGDLRTVPDNVEEPTWTGPSMLLLTGPNYSGKSIYQKQVALVVYLAHIGSFVPAESAVIGLTDKILTRISTRETVSKMQSAFMIDLQQIARAINHSTRRSLVVIDEFGKGTDSCDGAGLAAGVFRHFLELGCGAPKVLAATHFREIFDEPFLARKNGGLALGHMEVRVDRKGRRNAGEHQSEVTYLYNLREGRSTLSYGTQCAAMNGIPAQVVKRASELSELVGQGEDLVAVCVGMSMDEVDNLEDAEMCARAFLAQVFTANSQDLIDVLGSVLGESVAGTTT